MALKHILLIFCLFASTYNQARAAVVAVANNFYQPMIALNKDYSALGNQPLQISTGSTGQLYAQIVHGAPFDLFFAADTRRPQQLVQDGLGFDLFIYAKGSLVLWSPQVGRDLLAVLQQQQFQHLAMADPLLAPYGLAAQQALLKLKLWQPLQNKLVLGKGLSSTYQFIASGNADLGFVAKSQVFAKGQYQIGSVWPVPAEAYQAILQAAVSLKPGLNNSQVQTFLNYLKTERAQAIIKSYGYQ